MLLTLTLALTPTLALPLTLPLPLTLAPVLTLTLAPTQTLTLARRHLPQPGFALDLIRVLPADVHSLQVAIRSRTRGLC